MKARIKQSTAVMLIKLFMGLSAFTGIIVVIFLVFLPLSSQKSKDNSPSTIPSASPNQNPEETPGNIEGEFCGGIAAVQCPQGYFCQLEGRYPDAGGTCIKSENNPTGEQTIYCTADVKQCPDGSWVGRIRPKCEFAPCPQEL